MNAVLEEALKLPPPERLRIADALYYSVEKDPDAFPLTEAQEKELDRRLEDYRNDPGKSSSWEDVKARYLARR
ncbi:MAG: addiction module protein [Pyrinomonadaceae bacterium]